MKTFEISVHTLAGSEITRCIKEAIALAEFTGQQITFTHNGNTYMVNSGDQYPFWLYYISSRPNEIVHRLKDVL